MTSMVDLGADLYKEWRGFQLPRHNYSLDILGPAKFKLGETSFRRYDLELQNPRGQTLQCSHFQQVDGSKRPCVVYCHGACSSRAESVYILRPLLKCGITVFCFDFAGSGLSDGGYTSFGFHEQQDLRCVVQHLQASGLVSSIGLWGRSMGAVAAAILASKDNSIAACILDSPYSSLQRLATELLVEWTNVLVPDFVLNWALRLLTGEIEAQMDFRMEDLEILTQVTQAASPVIFAGATDDRFVQQHHVQNLHDAWGGADGECCGVERRRLHFGGGHNGQRPEWFIAESVNFLRSHLDQASATR